MFGCDGGLGELGQDYNPGALSADYSGWNFAGDVVKSVSSMVTGMFAPPTYQSTGPSGSTTIRYPTGIPTSTVGAASLIAATGTGISTTTLLMIALVGVVAVMAMKKGG